METDTNNDTVEETQDPSAAFNQAVVNYSVLPTALQGIANANASANVRAEKLNEMSKRLEAIEPQLDTMALNMHA